MKRTAIAGILFFVLCVASFPQSAGFAVPAETDLFYFASQVRAKDGIDDPLLYGFPVFRLWGWSAEGKIAFSLERAIEGRGGTEIIFTVQDLVTDKIAWQLSGDSNDWADFDPGAALSAIEYFHRLNSAAMDRKLAENKIRQKSAAYEKFPAAIAGQTYACTAKITPKPDAEFNDAIKEYRILVKRNNAGEKAVKTEKKVKAVAIHVCGYFKSPFEDRIAVVSAEERFVFEGTELFYSVSGCALRTGF